MNSPGHFKVRLARGRDKLVAVLNPQNRSQRDHEHLRLLFMFGMKANSNFLDVGASTGLFLRPALRVAPNGHHIAYEPVPNHSRLLAERFPTVEVRNAALSDCDAHASFTHVLGAGQQFSHLLDAGFAEKRYPDSFATQTITVRTERLDDHVPSGWLPDFVKIDVEGAERLVLRGAMNTFRCSRPVIAFEHFWEPEGSEELYTIITSDLGLRIFNMAGSGPLGRSQFYEELTTRYNWVAHD